MSEIRPWYYDYVIKYGIHNEDGDLIGISNEAPPNVKKAFEEDMAKEKKLREEAEKEGYLIS